MPAAALSPCSGGQPAPGPLSSGIVRPSIIRLRPSVGARLDVLRPALHRLDRERRALGDVSIGIDDPHLLKIRQ